MKKDFHVDWISFVFNCVEVLVRIEIRKRNKESVPVGAELKGKQYIQLLMSKLLNEKDLRIIKQRMK